MKKIVWPHYLECSLPRRLGRRVPKDLCIDNVSLEDILRACESLSIKCDVEEDKRYPRVWYSIKGRVLVEYDGPKTQLLKSLAREIRRLRASGTN